MTLLRKLAWLFVRRRKEVEQPDELDFHLAEEADERRASGLGDTQARHAAHRDLGTVALVIEDTRAAWGWLSLEQSFQDARYASRTIVRTPTTTSWWCSRSRSASA